MIQLSVFHPYENLAALLLQQQPESGDGSHDESHLLRVWRNACCIQQEDGGDRRVLLPAVLLHDCVPVEKSSPLRSKASELAAERAAQILGALCWSAEDIAAVKHAIEAHSFSAGIEPRTLEACILQDADRLDAIGSVGVARCFYTAGRMNSLLYDPDDAAAERRSLQDRTFALDHFRSKLLGLAEHFRTPAGQRIAKERHDRVECFYSDFLSEI